MSHTTVNMDAAKALEKLIAGNERYVSSGRYEGDVSEAVRLRTAEHGQVPYAVIVTCSDSRVIPEAVFSAGIGDLFVIRVAGNVIDDHQLGSIVYAAEHLGTKLVVVLGHTGCGAVGAAMSGPQEGYIAAITELIRAAIGEETDPCRACVLNAKNSVRVIEDSLNIPHGGEAGGLRIVPAVYDIASGSVEFLK